MSKNLIGKLFAKSMSKSRCLQLRFQNQHFYSNNLKWVCFHQILTALRLIKHFNKIICTYTYVDHCLQIPTEKTK